MYVLFRSFKITFSYPAPPSPSRRKRDHPAGRRLKIASSVDRQCGGWRWALNSALSSRDEIWKIECIEIIHLWRRSGRGFLFGLQNAGIGQCDNVGVAEWVGNVDEHYCICSIKVVYDTLECDVHWIYGIGYPWLETDLQALGRAIGAPRSQWQSSDFSPHPDAKLVSSEDRWKLKCTTL